MKFWWMYPITWKQAYKQYSAFVWPVPAATNIKLTRSNSVASEKCYRQEMWNIIKLTYYALQMWYTLQHVSLLSKVNWSVNRLTITLVIPCERKFLVFYFTPINRVTLFPRFLLDLKTSIARKILQKRFWIFSGRFRSLTDNSILSSFIVLLIAA